MEKEKEKNKTNPKLFFYSKNDQIETEKEFKKALEDEYKFDFDPCPLVRPEWDGLKVDWGKCNWVNPPFSNIDKWVRKALDERKKGNTTIMLMPCRPNSNYWHELVFPNASKMFFFNKIRFEGYKRHIPVPLVLIEFKPEEETAFKKETKGNKECWYVENK